MPPKEYRFWITSLNNKFAKLAKTKIINITRGEYLPRNFFLFRSYVFALSTKNILHINFSQEKSLLLILIRQEISRMLTWKKIFTQLWMNYYDRSSIFSFYDILRHFEVEMTHNYFTYLVENNTVVLKYFNDFILSSK